MKKIIISVLALFLGVSFVASAWDYEPTTTWPYAYPEFTKGVLHMTSGPDKEGLYNIHLAAGTLHFIDGELIKEASKLEIFAVQIGDDYYVNAGGRMMKVLAKNESGFVAESSEIDVVKLNSTGGAYGSSSSTLGTTALSSLEGIGGNRSNMNHMEIRANKESGETLPLLKKLFLVSGGKVVFASRKDLSEAVDANALKTFLKGNKIKWNDPQSLLFVVDFLSKQK